MPLTRYQVRNEYSLADPELYRAADKDDPEALLEGVAMAGLVGVLRQLGDLAEFAAEIFHDLHEEVMVTAARGHTLMVRVQQLESEFPPIEKAFLSQTSHSTFFSNAGTDWHPNLQTEQNLITKGDLPRFIMDSYEESRGPPRLFLLDKFDVAGAGACLKRYTDPSFYKVEASSFEMASTDVQRDKKFRKAKKKGPRWKNGETPENLPSTKLHQLFLEERVESGASDPARLVKLKRRLNASALDSNNGKSYMEKFLKTPSEDKVVHEVSVGSPSSKLPSNNTTEIQILDISKVGYDLEPVQRNRSPFPPPSLERTVLRPSLDDFCEDIAEERTSEGPTSTNPSFEDKDIAVDGEIKVDERESYHSDDDNASEIDNYMDALATMESEVDTDTEFRAKKDDVDFLNIEKHGTYSDANDEQLQSQSQFSDSQSIGNSTASDDGNSSIAKGVSTFSCSDTASTSAEDTQSTEIGKADVTCMPSNRDSTIEKVTVDPLPEHENDAFVEIADIQVDSAPLLLPVDSGAIYIEGKSEKLASDDISSNNSEISSGPTKAEEQSTDDSSENSSGPTETEEQQTDNNIEISSCPTKIKEQPAEDIGEISGGPIKTEKQLTDVDYILQKSDAITPTLSYEEHPEDEAEVEDPNVDCCTVIDSTDILEAVLEKEGSENSLEDVVQTKNAENVSARNSVDAQVMSPDSVISHAEEQPSVLPLAVLGICGTRNLLEEQLAENADDDLSDKFDSVEIGIVYSGVRDLDGTGDGELSLHGESDVDKGGTEPRVSLVASDFQSDFSESPDPPYLTDDHARADERENETVQSEAVVDRAPDSSLAEDHAQSDERETEIVQSEAVDERAPDSSLASEAKMSLNLDNTINVSSSSDDREQDLESDLPHDSSPIEETEDGSLSMHCFSALTSLEENVEPQTGQLDLQPPDTPGESPELSSLLEHIDSPTHLDHKTGGNADYDSLALTLPTQPPEQEKELQAEELDVGSLQVSEVTCESSQSEQVQLNETDRESCPAPAPLSLKASVSELAQSSSNKFDLYGQVKTPLSSALSDFNLLPKVAQLNLEEMPPLPPLPPMQWRIGKPQHASLASGRDGGQRDTNHFPPIFPSIRNESEQPSNPFLPFPAMNIENSRHEDLAGNMVNSTPFSLQMPTINDGDSPDDFLVLGQTHSSNPFTAFPAMYNERPQHAFPAGEGGMINPTINHGDNRNDFLSLGQPQSSNPFTALPTTYNERPQHAFPAGEGEMMQPTDDPSTPAVTLGPTSMVSLKTPHGEVNQSPHQLSAEVSLEKEEHDHSSVVSEMVVEPTEESVPQPPIENGQPEHVAPTCQEEIVSSSSTSALPSVDDEKSNGNRPLKLPRPRSPLIDAVAAHDKSKLKKVTERVRPQVQKVEERDTLLEQIRTKSFNLKPAIATRPIIQGPRTNLRVAAILEKANAIRQAFVGSDDDDDDDDSWSDS